MDKSKPLSMKKQLSWLLLSALMVGLLSGSCKQNGSGQAYALKMRLNKGDKFNQDMDMDLKMNFEVAAQKLAMDMKMDCGIAFEVKTDAPGSKELAMTYTKMNTSTDMKGVPGAEGMNNEAQKNEAMQKLIGKTITFTLNDKNEIISSAGVENVFWGDSTIDDESRKALEKMFSKDQMNSLFGMMFQMYPDKPVKVGEKWEKEVEVSVSGITMKSNMKYMLESVKDSIAYINIDGDFKGKGDMDISGMQMKMDMNGSQKGQIHIGLVNGYLKGGSYKMSVDGQMDMMGQKIPLKMEGDYFMKGN
jgi:hypothetical protein